MSDPAAFSMFELFREEVRAHAATLNAGLIELEADAGNLQRIEPLMRAAHSIKGAARIVDLDAAVELAHVMEDAFVAAQAGKIRIAPSDIDTFLKGSDRLASLEKLREETAAQWGPKHRVEIDELKAAFEAIAEGTAPPKPSSNKPSIRVVRPTLTIPEAPLPKTADFSMFDLFREELRANALALRNGLTEIEAGRSPVEAIPTLVAAVRAIKGAARIVGVSGASDLAAAMDRLLSQAEREGSLPTASADYLWQGTALFANAIGANEADMPARFAELPALESPTVAETGRRGDGETGSEDNRPTAAVPTPVLPVSPSPPLAVANAADQPPQTEPEAVVRVTAQSLNRLIGLAGESLVQARWLQPFAASLMTLRKQYDQISGILNDLAQNLADRDRLEGVESLLSEARNQTEFCRQVMDQRVAEFEDHSARAEDLNTRLYREVIVSRMRPFADGAHAFPRLVRDAARRLDKSVRFEMRGQSTEVDRDILEKLEAPLTHLLRNAIDHGIEPAAERAAAGKPETGSITVEAGHRAGMLVLTVSDDGRGIDPKRLREKIVEKGLTTTAVAQALAEAELFEFLFLPGFSTAGAATEFSGRGVGLDVVQTMVREVGGSVRIASAPGTGTRFHLKLPLTLSVVRAVLVDIAGEPYAFPHNRIDRLLAVPAEDVRSLQHRHFTLVDGQNVGLVVAAQILELPVRPLGGGSIPVVLLSDQSGQYGLIVERFRGEQDLVVRPLDPRLGKVPNVGAAAILDDGSPVLIADVEDMVRSMDRFIQSGSLLRCDREKPKESARKRVLVVDDSITVREVERQLLRGEGYDVETAVDGREGLTLAKSSHYDLIISDVDMPRMNGLEMVEALRKEDRLRRLPVIIVSYKEREEDRLRGLHAGANAYLTKSSFHDNTFLRTVRDLIGGARE